MRKDEDVNMRGERNGRGLDSGRRGGRRGTGARLDEGDRGRCLCLEVWGQGWWGDSRGEGPSGSQEEGSEEEVLGFLFEKCVVVGFVRRVCFGCFGRRVCNFKVDYGWIMGREVDYGWIMGRFGDSET